MNWWTNRPSDAKLLDRWRTRRDAGAFSEVVMRHAGMVFATCNRILGDRAAAEEVSQECFLALARGNGECPASPGGWLHTVAARLALKRVHSDAKRRAREEVYVERQEKPARPEWDDIKRYVDEAIEELPKSIQSVVVAHFLEQRTHREIAKELGVTRQAVTYRIRKGVAEIRRRLDQQGITLTIAALGPMLSTNAFEAAPAALLGDLGRMAMAGGKTAEVVLKLGSWFTNALAPTLIVSILAVTSLVVAIGIGTLLRPDDAMAPVAPEIDTEPTGPPEVVAAIGPAADEVSTPTNPAIGGGAIIEGRVYEKDTNMGVSRAVVQAYGYRRDRVETRTDDEGRYRFEGMPPGDWDVRLKKGSGVPGIPLAYSDAVHITLRGDGHVRRLDFAVVLGVTLSGRIRDRSGAAVAGAGILARYPFRNSASSDAEGAFVLAGLRANEEVRLQIKSKGFGTLHAGPFAIPPGGLSGVDITLQAESVISGIVVDRNGDEVSRVQVNAVDELGNPTTSYLGGGQLSGFGVEANRRGGDFELKGLSAGVYQLFARQIPFIDMHSSRGVSLGPRTGQEPLAEVRLAEGQRISNVRLVLDTDAFDIFEEAAQRVSGHVRNAAGEPVAGARVAPQHYDAQLTDPDGYFEVTIFSANTDITGRFERTLLWATADGYSRERVSDIGPDTTTLDIVLKRAGEIVGTVVDAETGDAITDFELASKRGDRAQWRVGGSYDYRPIRHPEGRFTLEKLEARPMVVIARARGYAPGLEAVSVTAGGLTEIEVALERSIPVEGIVLSPLGEPIEGANVGIGDPPDRYWSENALRPVAYTDPDGSFSLDSLPRSVTRLYAFHPGYLPGTADYEGVSGQSGLVTIRLEPGGGVEGIVSYLGTPVENSRVRLRYEGQPDRSFESVSDARGQFRFSGLRDGGWRLNVNVAGDGARYTFQARVTVSHGVVTTKNVSIGEYNASVEGYVKNLESVGGAADARVIHEFAPGERLFVSAEIQDDGYYRMDHLPHGVQEVRVDYYRRQASMRTITASVELLPGKVVRQDFDFGSPPSVRGNIAAPAGMARIAVCAAAGELSFDSYQSVSKAFSPLTGEWPPIMTLDVPGDYTLHVDEPGTYTVFAVVTFQGQHKPALWASHIVTLEEGQVIDVDFEF